MRKANELNTKHKQESFIEGEDFYYEDGLMVLTAKFLEKRGFCCGNNCRNCPYPKEAAEKLKQKNI